MEKNDAITALAALAQDNRLDVFRLLVRAGDKGMPAGAVAAALDLAPNTLSFHFDRLRQAGLVTCTRDGRSLIYAAKYDTMNALLGYLTLNCCVGDPGQSDTDCCGPAIPAKSTAKSKAKSKAKVPA
jgi:ArsR family transcriptional regulator